MMTMMRTTPPRTPPRTPPIIAAEVPTMTELDVVPLTAKKIVQISGHSLQKIIKKIFAYD